MKDEILEYIHDRRETILKVPYANNDYDEGYLEALVDLEHEAKKLVYEDSEARRIIRDAAEVIRGV